MSGLARRVHPIARVLALFTIVVFWTSSVAVEVFGDPDAVVAVEQAIPWGLLVLVPALAVTGASGFRLGAGSTPRECGPSGAGYPSSPDSASSSSSRASSTSA